MPSLAITGHHWPATSCIQLVRACACVHATKFSEILHWQLQPSPHDFISFSDTDVKKTSTNQILLTTVGKEYIWLVGGFNPSEKYESQLG